jgi:hypothetical protein
MNSFLRKDLQSCINNNVFLLSLSIQMPILSNKPMGVTINGEEGNLQNLINMLNDGNYPESFMLVDLNSQDFMQFDENGPNRYSINSGNNPYGLGRRHAMGGCDRENAGAEIMRFFSVDQIAGGARRRRRATRRRNAMRRSRKQRK